VFVCSPNLVAYLGVGYHRDINIHYVTYTLYFIVERW